MAVSPMLRFECHDSGCLVWSDLQQACTVNSLPRASGVFFSIWESMCVGKVWDVGLKMCKNLARSMCTLD